jgi:hypothetical protein
VSETTETLDAVTRLIQAVKREETETLAEVLKPAINYFMEADQKGREQSEKMSAHQRNPKELDTWELERYVNLCEKLKLDPKDPVTRTILKNLGKKP